LPCASDRRECHRERNVQRFECGQGFAPTHLAGLLVDIEGNESVAHVDADVEFWLVGEPSPNLGFRYGLILVSHLALPRILAARIHRDDREAPAVVVNGGFEDVPIEVTVCLSFHWGSPMCLRECGPIRVGYG
jgi:hypothetical protein